MQPLESENSTDDTLEMRGRPLSSTTPCSLRNGRITGQVVARVISKTEPELLELRWLFSIAVYDLYVAPAAVHAEL